MHDPHNHNGAPLAHDVASQHDEVRDGAPHDEALRGGADILLHDARSGAPRGAGIRDAHGAALADGGGAVASPNGPQYKRDELSSVGADGGAASDKMNTD